MMHYINELYKNIAKMIYKKATASQANQCNKTEINLLTICKYY